VKRYDGERIEVTYDAARCLHAAALCRCGKSANQPYCDHSGPCQQWEFQRGERSA
jgi:CDGSH-type Zn-finger protein